MFSYFRWLNRVKADVGFSALWEGSTGGDAHRVNLGGSTSLTGRRQTLTSLWVKNTKNSRESDDDGWPQRKACLPAAGTTVTSSLQLSKCREGTFLSSGRWSQLCAVCGRDQTAYAQETQVWAPVLSSTLMWPRAGQSFFIWFEFLKFILLEYNWFTMLN